MPLTVGQTLQNRYRILGLLGQGGMGAVYQAADTRLGGKVVAIKEMSDAGLPTPQQRQQASDAFRQEAQMLALLNHPNLPKVSDFFTENGKHYIVMEFVEGETLEDHLNRRGGSVSEAEARGWAAQLCDVLGYLHRQQPPVIFRDLKPANVMLTPQGQLKLIDFGIARFFKAGQAGDTLVMGTPGYAAPEQHGKGQTDGRSDVYSLGVLLHHVLTGHDPATTPFALPPVRQLNPHVSSVMEQVIVRATQVQPVKRFPTVEALCQALAGGTAGPLAGQPRRIGVLVSLAALVIVAVLAAVLLRSQPAPPPAAQPTALAVAAGGAGVTPATKTPTAVAPATAVEPPAIAAPPTPTATSSPTSMPTVTPQPTASPLPTPTPAAPPSLIAYTTGNEGAWQIMVADPATGQTWLQAGLPSNSGVAAWAPGGAQMAFRSKADGTWQIYAVDADGSNLRQLTSAAYDNLEPAWSPDGRQLAFVSQRDGNSEIYLMDADGSNQRRLTNNPGRDDDPIWSPDGRWLVFESTRNNRLDVYTMRVDGSDVQRLTSQGDFNSTPAWSPDGRAIAFERRSGGVYHIWLMDTNGGNQRQITFDGASNLRPAWSPDSREIAFTSDRDGTTAIWVAPVDLSQAPRRISPGVGFDAAWSRP
jgi:serine/threonine protein kinase